MEIELSDVFQQLKLVSHLAVMVQDVLGWNDYIRNHGARCARLEQLYLEIHDISAQFQIDFRQDSIKLTIWFLKFKPYAY